MTQTAPRTSTWASVLTDLITGHDLPAEQATWAMEQVMTGGASPVQIAAFLVGMRAKGPTGEEIAACVDSMLRHAAPFAGSSDVVDTCGTGGDSAGTVNLSSMAAIVVAATGRPVVKHGGRAASSKSGSADVFEALGIPLDLAPPAIEECLRQVGITFCFAPVFHPAMRYAGPVRKELGIPTLFNILGPLANPARPAYQLVGVSDAGLAPFIAEALRLRGTSALVVRGNDGLDEVTTTTATTMWEVRDGAVAEHVIDSLELGLPRPPAGALHGGDAAYNASVFEAVLRNDDTVAPVTDAVCINAAAALAACAPEGALVERLADGLAAAREVIHDGTAAKTLATWRRTAAALHSA